MTKRSGLRRAAILIAPLPTPGGQLPVKATRKSFNLVERWFPELTDKALRRGVFLSVPDLMAKIKEYLNADNDKGSTFVWTATAEQILAKGRPRPGRPRKSQSILRHVSINPETRQ